ncbi:MAG: hypothetical protein ACOC3Z_01625 [Nanoarchaeota archaeon]
MEKTIIKFFNFVERKPNCKNGLNELGLKLYNDLLLSEYLKLNDDNLVYITKKGRLFLDSLIYDSE